MEYEKLGIGLGDNPKIDLKLIEILQEMNIKFDIINLDQVCNFEKSNILIIDFLTYYRNINHVEEIYYFIKGNYKLDIYLTKSGKIIRMGDLDTILDTDDSNDLITEIFNEDFSKLFYNVDHMIGMIPIPDLMKEFAPIFSKYLYSLPIPYRVGIIRSLNRGLFSENPEFEEFLINLVRNGTKIV